MYLLAFVDRTNLSFVLPRMGADLDLSNTGKGLVSGVFFLGYILLQVPSALLADRWSAKKVVFIAMILWGLAAMACGFVQSSHQLLAARFLLGLFEGAVQPATLVLLTRWFPQRERARANGFWLVCIPLSAVIAAPLTGLLLNTFSWRTVLILEGLPPLIWAFVWLAVVTDIPKRARWITTTEVDQLDAAFELDARSKKAVAGDRKVSYRDALRDPKVLLLILAWFLYNTGFYGFTLWLPQVITNLTGGSAGRVGLFTAIPYVFGLIGMVIVAVRTDRRGSRPLSAAGPLAVAAIALFVGQFLPAPGQFALLCLTAFGLYIHGAFFALPGLVIRVEYLALSLGMINGLGNLGGFVGPYVFGWLIDVSGSTAAGFTLVSGALLGAGIALALVSPRHKITPTASDPDPTEMVAERPTAP
jgi:MFS family permease